jgi:pyrroline-5-carboxylate reductase
MEVFSAAGKAIVVDEKLMDVVTGLSGSGPAFVLLMIEAMVDAGVQLGLQRSEAMALVEQTFVGSAKMIIEANEHPAVLRNRVTSPGGTTAVGLFELESGGVRSTLARAVIAAANRSTELGE